MSGWNERVVAAVEQNAGTLLAGGFHRVTFGASATLAALFTAANGGRATPAQAGLKRLFILPDPGVTVTWNMGAAAVAGSAPSPSSGLTFPVGKAVADTLQFYGTGTGLILEIG